MQTTLLIMAAGIGSRFGTGIKQLAKVDDQNHIIMDYSIHDAIEAGFNKIVFIIRKDIEDEFKSVIGDRIEDVCAKHGVEVAYAYQAIDDIPGQLPEGRTKPWGTGQAVLSARDVVDSPFVVINADDYYGKEPYKMVHDFLCEGTDDFCMAGFLLKNTLSDNGTVTRGLCQIEDGYLSEIVETHNIAKASDGAESDGKPIDMNSVASMNMWGMGVEFMDMLQEGFKEFFKTQVQDNPMKSEYLIPVYIGELLEQGKVRVKALKTEATWCGMTYKEDIPAVKNWFEEKIKEGIYNADLYSDL